MVPKAREQGTTRLGLAHRHGRGWAARPGRCRTDRGVRRFPGARARAGGARAYAVRVWLLLVSVTTRPGTLRQCAARRRGRQTSVGQHQRHSVQLGGAQHVGSFG